MDWGLIVNHSLLYGAILSGVLSVLIITSLRINNEMWLQDFPPDVKAAWGPMSDKARRQRSIFAPIFFAVIIGTLILATVRLNTLLGGAPFVAVFASTAIITMMFNLTDAFIIDLLVLWLWPRLMMLPGTEGMAGYRDMRFWAVNLFKGFGFVIVAGLLTAGIASLVGWIGSML